MYPAGSARLSGPVSTATVRRRAPSVGCMSDRASGAPPSEPSLTWLVEQARAGDESAWRRLVERLERVVWKTVNMCVTDPEIRNDASAATWLRLVENLGRIRDPERLPGWLATTATNEVRQIIRQRSRTHVPIDRSAPPELFGDLLADLGVYDELDRDLLRMEAAQTLRRAFHELDEDCRMVLAVLVIDPEASYRAASETLGRPVGALGPTRRRCLDKLRKHPSVRVLLEQP